MPSGRTLIFVVAVTSLVSLAACASEEEVLTSTDAPRSSAAAPTSTTTAPTPNTSDSATTVTPTTVTPTTVTPTTVTPTTVTSTTVTSTTVAVVAPSGPVADLSEEIDGASAPFVATSDASAIDGYSEHEFVAAGTATSYRPASDLTADGRWTFAEHSTAPYRTRILVRRPVDPAAASGVVVVEWLNVSGGLDAAPDFTSLRDDIVRNGDIWVGVSAQRLGVMGGPVLVSVDVEGAGAVAGKGLVAIDPERYGGLEHPGDGYSFDMFTQVARALRSGGDVLGGVTPTTIIAAGESQSALALTTYLNGVHPLASEFDGFFVHSRAAVALPLADPGEYADLAGGITTGGPTIIRDDTSERVMVVQAEGDVVGLLNSISARQPDSDTFRLWEVAGTAHVDRWTLGAVADAVSCGVSINDAPMHVVVKAAYRSLVRWIVDGTPPPTADRLATTADGAIERNADGIALGGIRTPPVDVPVDVLSGATGPNPSSICLLAGTTTALSDDRLRDLHGSAAAYEAAFLAAADVAIDRGFVLAEDRDALLAYMRPERVPG